MILHDKLASVVRQKLTLYDKDGLGVRQKSAFSLQRVTNWCLYYFKSYWQPIWSFFNWSSNKSEREVFKNQFFVMLLGGGDKVNNYFS